MIKLSVFTDDFEIRRPDGSVAAEIDSGKFSSSDKEIFPFRGIGVRTSGTMIYLPAGRWLLADRASGSEGLVFDAVEEDLRLRAETSCLNAELELDSAADLCLAKLEGTEGSFDVSLYSGKDKEKGVVRTDLSGRFENGPLTVGYRSGRIVTEGGPDLLVSVR